MNSGELECCPLSKEVGGCKGDLLFFLNYLQRSYVYISCYDTTGFHMAIWCMYVCGMCVCKYLTKSVQENEIYPYYQLHECSFCFKCLYRGIIDRKNEFNTCNFIQFRHSKTSDIITIIKVTDTSNISLCFLHCFVARMQWEVQPLKFESAQYRMLAVGTMLYGRSLEPVHLARVQFHTC